MNKSTFLIQGSSRSWDGGQDLSMNLIDGVPVIKYTAQRIIKALPEAEIIIAAPQRDLDGAFETIFSDLVGERLTMFFGFDDSPLLRMVYATAHLPDHAHFIRVDGLQHGVLVSHLIEMLALARSTGADLVKAPDDFPIQITGHIYRVGALRHLSRQPLDGSFHVHPKYAMLSGPTYKTIRVDAPKVTDDYLRIVRERSRSVYRECRLTVDDSLENSGSQMVFHYEIALRYLKESSRVLDIACGDGFGSRLLAKNKCSVIGGDLCPKVIDQARQLSQNFSDLEFRVLDVTNSGLEDDSFDAVVSMETIEHVEEKPFLTECNRLIRPGGLLILSTPQNSLGHIPVCFEHTREYSLRQLLNAISPFFELLEVVGLKQGQVAIKGDPIGTNVIVIARKRILNACGSLKQ